MNTRQSLARLRLLCDIIPPLLLEIGEPDLSAKPAPGKWSKKELIGHLIDSATNNHHRFVRGQFEDLPRISYDQDAWNAHGYYQQMSGLQLIAFWEHYNRHLLALLQCIPGPMLGRRVATAGESSYVDGMPQDAAPDLAFLIDDYVAHLEHHLRQLVSY